MDHVSALAREAGVALVGLERARRRSDAELERLRERLRPLDLPPGACVAVMGSLGRREMTAGSDIDYAVLADAEHGVASFHEQVAMTLEELGYRSPSSEGPFARSVSVRDVVSKIGLDPDTNANLTRRMLLVLESVPVAGPGSWGLARATLLDRYLRASLKSYQPPRFFLNDVIRYWRTLAVDYEGKMEIRKGEGWAIRNAKLRLSRKMLFAGGLLPLLECARLTAKEMPTFLTERLAVSPADRLAAAFLTHDASEVGGRVLLAYSQFLDLLDDGDKRAELEAMSPDPERSSPLWREVESLGAAFQRGLDALLFETGLRPTVREYGIF